MATIDHDPLVEARLYRDRLEALLKEVREAGSEVDKDKHQMLVDTLEYALQRLRDHYRNYVNVYALAQKGDIEVKEKPKQKRRK